MPRYYDKRRLCEAAETLKAGGLNAQEAAIVLGISDTHSYLTYQQIQYVESPRKSVIRDFMVERGIRLLGVESPNDLIVRK